MQLKHFVEDLKKIRQLKYKKLMDKLHSLLVYRTRRPTGIA